MTDMDAYIALIEHSRTWLFDLPESDDLYALFELRFTPEEAIFLSGFPHIPHDIEKLSQRMSMAPGELLDRMAPLIKRGILSEVEGKSATRYAFLDPLSYIGRMPGWLGVDDEWNRKIATHLNRFYIEHFGPGFTGGRTQGLRAIPVAKTVEDMKTITPYEDILGYVDREDYHTVSFCACRHRHNIDPEMKSCEHETENCLHFGRLGRYIVKNGMGRKIEKAETLDILARAADAGLVHGMSNTKAGMDTICSCCSCCCIFLEKIKIAPPNPRGHQRSNYMLRMNNETCKACGLCVKRCPMGSLKMREKNNPLESVNGGKAEKKDLREIVYDADRCIGCGVCAHKCPTQSIKLVCRGKEEDIPANFMEAGMRILHERGRDMTKIF